MEFDRFVGLLWKEHGRGPDYDCWGLIVRVFKDLEDIDLPSHADDYTTTADIEETQAIMQDEVGDWIEVLSPARLDVLVKRFGKHLHVGVFVDNTRVLHILQGSASIIEPFKAIPGRTDGVYRHRRMV